MHLRGDGCHAYGWQRGCRGEQGGWGCVRASPASDVTLGLDHEQDWLWGEEGRLSWQVGCPQSSPAPEPTWLGWGWQVVQWRRMATRGSPSPSPARRPLPLARRAPPEGVCPGGGTPAGLCRNASQHHLAPKRFQGILTRASSMEELCKGTFQSQSDIVGLAL